MHLNNELIFLKYAKPYFQSGQKIIEIGPQGNPTAYQKLVDNPAVEWHSLDIIEGYAGENNHNFIFTKDPYNYPIADNTYDLVFSGGVMCNVGEIWTWMQELKRIVKPGGLIITITPISWPYANAPVDCWRIYPDGFKALNNFLGLETIHCSKESLELQHFGFTDQLAKTENLVVPYVSAAGYSEKSRNMTSVNKHKMLVNRLLKSIPLVRRYMNPVHTALDTISVAKK
ncbi:MAG TPA: methyltransferase domain-containing protein [Flavipsychrobacter sp.]|nr:methyltransferase domain-containing protein [Flavipsychrobacter sp.]